MLKYLLSTFCVFLFFEDVRLNSYKCASPNCSVFISKATVRSVRLSNSKHEVNVKKGEIVDVYGVDTEKKNYLVKVNGKNGLYLLPQTILKENVNILQKATIDVEDPFQHQSPQLTSTKQKQCENTERFYSIVFNNTNTCLSSEEEVSTGTIDQPSNNENEEDKESLAGAATSQQKETLSSVEKSLENVTNTKDEILEHDTTETNETTSNPDASTPNGTENVSISTQVDSATENHGQTNLNETEESGKSDDISIDVVDEDLVDQDNKSNAKTATEVKENSTKATPSSAASEDSVDQEHKSNVTVAEVKENSTNATPSSATSNDTSSNLPPQTSIFSQSNTQPKISFGDTPFGTSVNNFTSDENQTVRAEMKSKMNKSGDASLNLTARLAKSINPLLKTQLNKMNSNTSAENKTTAFKLDDSTLNSKGNPEEEKNITKADEKEELPEGTSPVGASKSLKEEEKHMNSKSNSEKKSEPSKNHTSSDSSTTDLDEKQKENAETLESNPPTQDDLKKVTSATVAEEEKSVQETGKQAASPDSISTDDPHESKDREHAASSASVEKSESSNENTSDTDKSNEENITQETGQPPALPGFTSTDYQPPVTPVPSFEFAVKNEDAIPEISTDDLKAKEHFEPDLQKNQFNSGAEHDSPPEKEVVLGPSQFFDAVPKNTNDVPADQINDVSKDSDQNLEDAIFKEESAFYTDIFGYIGNFSSLFENVAALQSYLNFEWLQKHNGTVEQHCDEESCPAFSIFDSMAKYGFDVSAINLQSWSLTELHQSKQTSLVAGILLCTVLLFTTLVSILRNSKKKSRINTLISVVNQLEKKLLVATKEISLLEEQLTDAPVTLVSQPTTEVDYESSELLQQQIELLQVRNTDLEDKVTYLEKELHNVTTSAFEIHKLLENSLSTQAQSRLAEDEVDTLRSLTERQDRQIDDLMKEMDAIVTENRYLKDDLKKVEKEFGSLTKKNLELTEKNRNLSLRLDQQIEETATMKSNYKSEIYHLQAKIEDLEINLRRSEFQVESLNQAFMDKHENKSDDQMQALQDDVQLKLQLSTLKAMNNELSAELKEQKNARRTLDDHIGDVIRKCNELTQALEVSEKGRSEAVNKLQVLTDYFNEKESQLQKEISAKEKLFMESENKDQLLSQKLSSLKEEIKNNKERNEELKKEIEAQERSFKTQLATAEQKSRDLWFALRQAERKYQESEKEAATLRNKILILENNLSSANQKLNEKHSTNGDINGQPLMYSAEMLSYRGPNDFIPPPPSPLASHSPEFFPPEPSYSPDERLPPLGGRRVPSPPSLIVPPPEDDDFKPPLPHAQYMPGRSRHDSLNMSSYYGDNAQYN